VRTCAALVIAASLMFAACGDDDGSDRRPGDAAASPGISTVADPSEDPAPTFPAVADETPESGVVEIRAIVGTVNLAAGTIIINQVEGEEVEMVEVTPNTEISSARGNLPLGIDDLGPSDRIVARGQIQNEVLVADEIVVQPVIPGAQPGG
jgi:hypothetical protein